MKTVCVYLHDGLGNQCFLYAAAKALALRANASLRLNADCLGQDAFGRTYALGPFAGVPLPMPTRTGLARKLATARTLLSVRFGIGAKTCPCEHAPARYRPLPTAWHGEFVLRNGYWQSERYFEDFRGEILRDFRLKDDAWLKADALARRIEATENSVFLHVRTYKEVRGNEDGKSAIRMRDYYRNALGLLAARLPSATVFVFSDEIDWTRRNVLTKELLAGLPFEFVYDRGGDLRDFMLMRLCRHGIAAESSFSWWAGWLGEQERLARGETAWRFHVNRCTMNDDYWPARWVSVEG